MNPTRTLTMALARISPLTMLSIILGLAATTTWFIYNELNKKPTVVAAPPPPKQMMQVLVAARDVHEGETMSMDDVRFQNVEATRAPVDSLSDATAVLGHPAKYNLVAGSMISTHALAPLPGTTGFQSKLQPGERAVTFGVDSTTGVAGFVLPDSHVDIMLQVGGGADAKTKAILSDVRVVASGTMYKKIPRQSEAQQAGSVTVAVNPAEAGKLINAMSVGKLYLTLRNDHDHSPIQVSDVGSMFKRHETAAPMPALLPPFTVLPEPPKNSADSSATPSPPIDLAHHVEQWSGSSRNETAVR